MKSLVLQLQIRPQLLSCPRMLEIIILFIRLRTVLDRGELQDDIGSTMAIYEKYWEMLEKADDISNKH